MGVPLKLFSFAFGIFYVTFARCQDCLPTASDIQLEDTEPLDQRSYNDGETVKVNCITGFIGMYKFKCNKGIWERTLDRKCTKKKCGHPGDTPNGDFSLLGGNTEFVFGATVQYTCNKGYEMASRINKRTCRSNGWDNAVPACEMVKCLTIHTEEDVIATGNTEEGSYGDVIQFDCKSPEKSIDGSSDIYCMETGEWSASVPKCKEISCKPPNLRHGTIKQRKEYKRDDTLQYECDTGYKPRQGTPKCTKHGWTLEAECEDITCELKETKFGIERIVPEGKHFFRVGETVHITCSETYRIFFTKETVKTFKCLDNGQWDNMPVCEEITCEVPRDRRLYYASYYFYGNMRLDDRRTYRCLSDYRQMASEATCTKDGWKPDPLCADIMCEAPKIPNAQFEERTRTRYEVYSSILYHCRTEPQRRIEITCNSQGSWTNIQPCTEKKESCTTPTLENGYIHRDSFKKEIIYYSCNPGYKPDTGNWWGAATCTNGIWKDEPRCTRVDKCGVWPSIQNGHLKNHTEQSALELKCDPGFKPLHTLIRCVNGTWEKPTCELDEQSCASPPKVDNALIISKPLTLYLSGSYVNYKCRTNFTMDRNSKIECRNASWEKAPTCEAFCSKPLRRVNNAILIDQIQSERKYSHGDTAHYECVDDYESNGQTIAKCDAESWIYPECIKKAQCTKPMNLQFVTLVDEKNTFSNFDVLRYTCNKPYDKIPNGALKCKNGKWNSTFECTSSICPPPPMIENGDFNVEREIDKVITSVTYSCKSYFVLNEQQRYHRCLNGQWETPPKCLKPCKITPDIYKDHNIRPVSADYIEHSAREVKLYCNSGWNVGGFSRHSYSKASCTDGELRIESKCKERNWTTY
nr:complement factor H-like isoform X2 [Misgurnus anguillicaudatus]